MALPPIIYRVVLQLADVDRGRYEKLQVTVARHPSETPERLVARLLAYALCYEEGLTFTKGVGSGEEPDLWLKGPDGRVRLWLEVGLPEAERMAKTARHAERVVLLACGKGLPRWQSAHLPRLAAVPNLTIFSLDPAFLQALIDRLQRFIDWELTLTGGTLYLAVGGETLEATIHTLVSTGGL
jgi:uncharacterized protein YaeQ